MNHGRPGRESSQRRISMGAALLARSGPFEGPAGTFAVLLALALAMVGFVEIQMGFPLTTGMTLGFLVCCGLLFLPFLLVNRSRMKCVMAFLFLVAVLGIHLTPWNTRKLFLKDLRHIQTGMTAAEVDRMMERWMSGSGSSVSPEQEILKLSDTTNGVSSSARGPGDPGNPASSGITPEAPAAESSTPRDAMAFRHSKEPRFKSDLGLVRFKNGRVVAVEFLSD